MAASDRHTTLRRAIETCIHPDDASVAGLADLFADDVTVWSPNLLAVGLADLAESLSVREDAFSNVVVEIDALDVLGDKGFVEFRVAADFTGPFVIGDDLAVEPNGRRLLLGAAAVAEFAGDKIQALRGYFDDATLLEQMVAG